MKVYRDLYNQVTSFENLWWAERKAAKGKGLSRNNFPFLGSFDRSLGAWSKGVVPVRAD